MQKEVYHPFPKFENPIYRLAQEQKRVLREESIKRIKNGTFEALGTLYQSIGELNSEEIESITNAWHEAGLTDLASLYEAALRTNSLPAILESDRKYILYNYSKNQGGMRLR